MTDTKNPDSHLLHSSSLIMSSSEFFPSSEDGIYGRCISASALALSIMSLYQLIDGYVLIDTDHDEHGFSIVGEIPRKIGKEFLQALQEVYLSRVRDDVPFRLFSMTAPVLEGYLENEGIPADSLVIDEVDRQLDKGVLSVIELVEIGSGLFCTLQKEAQYAENGHQLKWCEYIALDCQEIGASKSTRGSGSFSLMIRGVIGKNPKEVRKKKSSLISWYDSQEIFSLMKSRRLWHAIKDIESGEGGVGFPFSSYRSVLLAHGMDWLQTCVSSLQGLVSFCHYSPSPYASFQKRLRRSSLDISVHIAREWAELFKDGSVFGSVEGGKKCSSQWMSSLFPISLELKRSSQEFLSDLSTITAMGLYRRVLSAENIRDILHEICSLFLHSLGICKERSCFRMRYYVSSKDKASVQKNSLFQEIDSCLSSYRKGESGGDSALRIESSSLLRKGEIACVLAIETLHGLIEMDLQSFIIKLPGGFLPERDHSVKPSIPSSKNEASSAEGYCSVIPSLSVEKSLALSLFQKSG